MESLVLLVLFFGGILADYQSPLTLPIQAEDDLISNLQLLIPMRYPDSQNLGGKVVMVLETPSDQSDKTQVPPITPLLIDRSPISLSDDDDNNEVQTSKELLELAGMNNQWDEELENGMIVLSSGDSMEIDVMPSNNVEAEKNLKSSLQYLCSNLLAREQIVLSQPNESLRRSQEARLPPTLIRSLCRRYLWSLSDIQKQETPQPPSAPFRNLKNLLKLKNYTPKSSSDLNSLSNGWSLNKNLKKKNKKVQQPVYKQMESKQNKCTLCDLFRQHVQNHFKGNAGNNQLLGGVSSDYTFRGNDVAHGNSCSVCQLIRQIVGQGLPVNRHRRSTLVGEEYPGMFKRVARTGFFDRLKKRGDLRSSIYPKHMDHNYK